MVHDLARFVFHFALLFRVTVVEENVDVRQNIKCDGMGEDFRRGARSWAADSI